jgi:hypothetical protein
MKNNHLFVFLILVFVTGCSPQTADSLPEFPLHKGTTWVYSYSTYDTSMTDPNQIIKAAYQLTETVVETENISNYVVGRVEREHQLVNSDPGWIGDLSNQPSEFWYVVNGNQVFQRNRSLDTSDLKLEELILDYEFPLSIGKDWCLFSQTSKNPKQIMNCEVVGKRQVTDQGSYETTVGNFDHCYDLIDYFNGGNIFQKFCNGVGVVYMKFDHAGTRFGYEKTLIAYSLGNQ